MTSRFIDRFDRPDGAIGTNYLVACGGVLISDESVVPIDLQLVESGMSPLFAPGVTAAKTQVFFNEEAMDGPSYLVRGTFANDDTEPSAQPPTGVLTEPSFTLLARMSKDPLLFDLGVDEEPACFDQGYGARVTFPLDETAPVLKIIKFQPNVRIPNLTRPASTEVDGALVLASVVLDPQDLNLDSDFDAAAFTVGDRVPYRGNWQDMRLRIRREDREVILEVYLNDRSMNQPRLTHTDKRDPLWGGVGLPGFEFLSAQLLTQPTGVSPFGLAGLSTLRCGIFQVETFRDITRPVQIRPGAEHTYQRIVDRVITLVERDGDARYNATTNAATKNATYLQFVHETELDIIRKVGHWDWMIRSESIFLVADQLEYELPEDYGELGQIRPGNWNRGPLAYLDPSLFYLRLGGDIRSGGTPTIYTMGSTVGPNNRRMIRIFPVFTEPSDIRVQTTSTDDAFLIIDYFARALFPSEPALQIPFVPQEDIDTLIYGAAAHALTLDTDPQNSQIFAGIYRGRVTDMRRKQYRQQTELTIARSVADVRPPGNQTRIPLLRSVQLESFI